MSPNIFVQFERFAQFVRLLNGCTHNLLDIVFKVYEGADARQQPADRVGNPLYIINIVLYLYSDKAGFITIENICIDGSMIRQMIYLGDFG